MPLVYQNILELIKTTDATKYTDEIETIISTKYQTIIFNSLEKKFVSLANEMITKFEKIDNSIDNEQAKADLLAVSQKFRVNLEKIYNQNFNINKIEKMLEK
ncbi:MAG: hypothetical protein EIB84_02650 [Spiroplasma poulsonii]|uniref:Uncharacterized protein n=1 Tax=Spiroplasma poulsonii TaxID=2138 RepID=A0A2P6FG37_9MOLU|nr:MULTISPECIES: hypothetical protein [Spiroplasma]KAF0849932.1 hypothetical protein MSROBK_023860 [Spiroplasma poulsonii]MBH8622797.1 hypothetical protein [Spiroplasma sp. hyd1]MBW1241772.1 hypothetical protein [Spiroplasma poulsonii]PQM32426.1 hypothetical protein SMSRO_SF023430 [Spiroplasma poulsonii]PWF95088.1 hypothetical protein SMSE_05130 [Spiroplasma poulsonii]